MRAILTLGLIGMVALAQEASSERIAVQLSDPSRPGMLRASLMNGCFNIEGYEGREVLVDGRRGGTRVRRTPRAAEGLRRIDPSGLDVIVEVDDNNVKIQGNNVDGDLMVRVPRNMSMKVSCMNGGELKVTGVTGDLELNNHNSGISVSQVNGSIVAHSLNGNLRVALDRISPDKPMSFSSLNGNVDVTLPPDARATLRMKSDNGSTFTDFEVQLTSGGAKTVEEDNRRQGGRYRVRTDNTMVGSINGGGPDVSLKTLNGNIYLRKRK
jgi:DUF4097 and DUF4098 domain-containing protein YvlB